MRYPIVLLLLLGSFATADVKDAGTAGTEPKKPAKPSGKQ